MFLCRLVSAVLGPLVCDLDAARGISGFSSHASTYFCSYCRLTKKCIGELRMHLWPPRSLSEHLQKVGEWMKAPDQKWRDKLWKLTGVRWSPFLWLPYWDPHRFVVVDAMHNILLGVLQHHLRAIWRMGFDFIGWDGCAHETVLSDGELAYGKSVLRAFPPRKAAIAKLRRELQNALLSICEPHSDPAAFSTKDEVLAALMQWVCTSSLFCDSTDGIQSAQVTWSYRPGPCRARSSGPMGFGSPVCSLVTALLIEGRLH